MVSLKYRFMFSQTLLLNEYCLNLILDQRENVLCIKQEKLHFLVLKTLCINASTFIQGWDPTLADKSKDLKHF